MRTRAVLRVAVAISLTACGVAELPPAVSCTPGDLQCQHDGSALVCVEQGNAWLTSSCAQNQVCIPGGGGEDESEVVCKDIGCTPEEAFCGGSRVNLYTCDSTGTTTCYAETCAVPPTDGVCSQGQCVSTCGEGLK